MATRRKGNSDRKSSVPERQRKGSILAEATAGQMGQPEAKSPVQLYEECAAAERKLATVDLNPLKVLFAKSLFFGQPLFDPAPAITDDPVEDKVTDLKIRTLLWQGGKYRQVLECLRLSANREYRLFVIAWWLKQENVCEPEDILGPEKLHKMARKKFYFLSESEFQNARRVTVWLPYFERLLGDLRETSTAKFGRLGYQSAAVAAARGKRSAVEAACSWLALPSGNALTLRNAYSKLYGPKRLRRKGYSV